MVAMEFCNLYSAMRLELSMQMVGTNLYGKTREDLDPICEKYTGYVTERCSERINIQPPVIENMSTDTDFNRLYGTYFAPGTGLNEADRQ